MLGRIDLPILARLDAPVLAIYFTVSLDNETQLDYPGLPTSVKLFLAFLIMRLPYFIFAVGWH
jgi:hypothetical protein